MNAVAKIFFWKSILKKKILVTHNNLFHADDVCAYVLLIMLFGEKNIKLIRTRNDEIINFADIVFDEGSIFDNEKYFDHHYPINIKEKRENGIPYASFGMIWKKYGKDILKKIGINNYIEEIFLEFDRRVIQLNDASDNYFKVEFPDRPIDVLKINHIVGAFNIQGFEKNEQQIDEDQRFFECAKIIHKIIKRFIYMIYQEISSFENVKKIADNEEFKTKKYFVIDEYISNWKESVEIIEGKSFCIIKKDLWTIYSIPHISKRILFPASWAISSKEELRKFSHVEEIEFVSKNRIYGGATTRDGAIRIVEKVLEIYKEHEKRGYVL